MIVFLIKATVLSGILYLFYKLLLERESFYQLNRVYLLSALVLILVLPFITLPKLVKNQGAVENLIAQINTSDKITNTNASDSQLNISINNEPQARVGDPPISESREGLITTIETYSLSDWIIGIYLFGVLILTLNLLFQIATTLFKIITSKNKIKDDKYIIVNGLNIEPCSFFNFIFIDPRSYSPKVYEQIIKHEKVHAHKWHSIDLLLAEISIIVLWINPFAWFLRKDIEKNIEYEADNEMLQTIKTDKEDYQLNLVNIASNKSPLAITTNYNQSLIKKRIVKMNSKKSNINSYWKYSFTLPVLLVSLLFLNKPIEAVAQNAENNVTKNEPDQNENTESNRSKEDSSIPFGQNDGSIANPLKVNDQELSGEVVPNNEKTSLSPCEELINAVFYNRVEEVKKLLKEVDANCEIIKPVEVIYINKGKENISLRLGRTPLVEAGRRGNLEMAKLLVDNGAKVDHHSENDESPLMAAAKADNVQLLDYLVKNGADVNLKLDGDGTALIGASNANKIENVKFLLSKGADVNGQVDYDGTSLIWAVRNDNYELAKLLLENGADPVLVSPGDEYPMYHARTGNNKRMISLLEKYIK